jgi:hypothetical protein
MCWCHMAIIIKFHKYNSVRCPRIIYAESVQTSISTLQNDKTTKMRVESTIKSQRRLSQSRKLRWRFCHDYVVTRKCARKQARTRARTRAHTHTHTHTHTQNKCYRTNLILYIFHATMLHIQYLLPINNK